jgi:hypothetical protein
MDYGVKACLFAEQSETAENDSLKQVPSPLEDGFVRSLRTTDVSQNKALEDYGFRPQPFIEIRQAQVYLLDTSFLC